MQMDGSRRFRSGKVQDHLFELVYVSCVAPAKGCAFFERAVHRVTGRALSLGFACNGSLNRVQLNTCTELGVESRIVSCI